MQAIGEKAISCEPNAVTSLSKWPWLAMSEDMCDTLFRLKRRQAEPANVG